jgi:hypothetical protein
MARFAAHDSGLGSAEAIDPHKDLQATAVCSSGVRTFSELTPERI